MSDASRQISEATLSPVPFKSSGSRIVRMLARETTSGEFIPQLDGLRFFAVLAVVMFHLDMLVLYMRPLVEVDGHFLHRVLSKGYVGVQLFFAISGFVLALPFAMRHLETSRPLSLKKYYLRRVTRLEPPYIINLVIMWAAQAAVKGLGWVELLPHLLASIFYVHYPVYGGPSTVNAVAWSLEVEVQFYVLAPVLTMVFAVQRPWFRRGLIILMIGGLSAAAALSGPLENHGFTLAHQLQYFLVGFLLVDFYLVEWKHRTDSSVGWDALASVAWVTIGLTMALAPRLAHVLVPVSIFFAYAGALRGRLWRRITSNAWLFTIGGMCYTIYLYNNQLVTTLGRLTMKLVPRGASYEVTMIAQIAVLVPLVIAISAVLFVLFEKPFMRRGWPTHWWGRMKARRVTPATD